MVSEALVQVKASDLAQHYGVRRFHVLLILTAILMQALNACIFGPVPYVMESIRLEFGVSDGAAAMFGSAGFIGSAFGTFLCGRMSDVLGRRKTSMICALALMWLSLFNFAIPSRSHYGFNAMIALRVLTGVPYGGILAHQYTLVSEFVPDHVRGTAGCITTLGWHLGVVYLLCFMPVYHAATMPWRFFLAVAPLGPGILCLITLYCLPESPRWHLSCGRKEAAQESLNVIFASEPIYGTAAVGPAPDIDISGISGRNAHDMTERSTTEVVKLLFSRSLLWTTVVSCGMYVFFCGPFNALWMFGPFILENASGQKPGGDVFRLAECCAMFGVLASAIMIDRIGRIRLIACGFLLTALSVWICLLGDIHGPLPPIVAWMVLRFVESGLGNVVAVHVSEVFPTSLRGTAVGFALSSGRVSSVMIPLAASIYIRESASFVLLALMVMLLVGSLLASTITREMSSVPMEDVLSRDKDDRLPVPAICAEKESAPVFQQKSTYTW